MRTPFISLNGAVTLCGAFVNITLKSAGEEVRCIAVSVNFVLSTRSAVFVLCFKTVRFISD